MKTFDQTEIKFYMIFTHRGVRTRLTQVIKIYEMYEMFPFTENKKSGHLLNLTKLNAST